MTRMMSVSGGWFFVVASEAISVLNKSYQLPGLGSYVALAIAKQNATAIAAALVTMIVVIVIIDQLFWRPLVAWSDKFKIERTGYYYGRYYKKPYYASEEKSG